MEKVVLVTGSGRRRVGSVVARVFGERGYRVAIHYHQSREAAEAVLGEFQQAGIEAAAFLADVREEAEVDRLFDAVIERFGRLDVLVTTASIWKSKLLEDVTAEDVLESFQVNTLGTFLCCRRGGLRMADQPEGGAIVTIGDWAIERPYAAHAPYFLAKGSIPTLTRMMAVELAERNPRVRVNCIHPGPIMFPPDLTAEEQRELIASTLVRDADCPDMLARLALHLAENTFLTGTCIPLDGGRTIYAP